MCKANSVQEPCIKCLTVHTLKFEILKPALKMKQKTLDALVFPTYLECLLHFVIGLQDYKF